MPPQVQSASDVSDPTFPSFLPATNSDGTAAKKRAQPLEKLKFRNLPFGATDTTTKAIVDRVDPQREHSVAHVKRKADLMDVDEEPTTTTSAAAATASSKDKKEKKKSRKSEVAGEDKEKKSERKEKKSRKSVA